MKNAFVVVLIGSLASMVSCASSPGTAEDFTWSAEFPKSVDKGAEFTFMVKTANSSGQAVDGVKFRYQIHWPGGSAQPLRHKGRSGELEKVHARLVPGMVTVVFTSENREGLDSKVLESSFEVK
jgi:hypothetical protein